MSTTPKTPTTRLRDHSREMAESPIGVKSVPLEHLAYEIIHLVDRAAAIARTVEQVVREEDCDTSACMRGINHLLEHASSHAMDLWGDLRNAAQKEQEQQPLKGGQP